MLSAFLLHSNLHRMKEGMWWEANHTLLDQRTEGQRSRRCGIYGLLRTFTEK